VISKKVTTFLLMVYKNYFIYFSDRIVLLFITYSALKSKYASKR